MAKAKRVRSANQLANDKRLRDQAEARRQAKSQNKNLETKTEPQVLGAEEILSINETTPIEEAPTMPTAPQPDTIAQPDIGDLMRQVQELKAYMFDNMGRPAVEQAKSSVQNGKLTGTVDRYSMDFDRYPDPRSRLTKEPKLARFAFTMNYELDWEIGESAYETIDHIRQREPKFTLTLIKIMIDEDTGEPTNGRYDICRLIMHEDPVAALIVARDNGLEVDEMDETTFLNEMRYIRMRDWLVDAFYPPKVQPQKQKTDRVINGKLVQYWEKAVEEGSGQGGIKKNDWDNIAKVKF